MTLNIFDKLKPCKWKWKHNNKVSFGFIAQDLLEIFPEDTYDVVVKNENGLYSVNYYQIIPFLVEEIRKLQHRVDELENGSNKSS